MKHTRQARDHVNYLAYGNRQAQQDRAEIAELGRTAIKGVVTVGTVGITAGLMGATLGAINK